MKIQSLSIHVPTKGCINNCPYCVSKSHANRYEHTDRYFTEIRKRLSFVKHNGVNNVIITGEGEPLQNKNFLENIGFLLMENGFHWIEFQTSGNFLLSEKRLWLEKTGETYERYEYLDELKRIGTSTISLSIADIFDSKNNADILQIPEKHQFNIDALCGYIKDYGFNLRLSINMVNLYKDETFDDIFDRLKELDVDQVTFRKLYSDGKDKEISKWINENSIQDDAYFQELNEYIINNGKFLGKLPYGMVKYSVNEISTVIDNNCMDDASEREEPDTYKYLILRPNGKLYSDWEDKGSLIF